MDMKVDYQVVNLNEVMRYFAKDFKIPEGRVIFEVEHFIDTIKGVVVFKLVTESAS